MTETERTEKFLNWVDRRALVTGVLVVALMVSVVVNVGVWWQAQQRAENATQTAVSFAQQVQDACANGGLPVDGRDLCPRADEIVEDPAAPPVPQDAPPPSDAQVAAGVADWFDTHDLSLTAGYSASMEAAVTRYLSRNPPADGEDGEDAPEPTDQQIAAQVAAYLITNPPADGADGTNGTNGRGVVSASLDNCDVVFTYTDHTTDRVGPICGADGQDGDKGEPGVSIEKVECPDDENDDWLYTFTDGTTQIVPGPCRVEPIIEPSPSPSPQEQP